jgi:Phasin protein
MRSEAETLNFYAPTAADGQKLLFAMARMQGHAFKSMLRFQMEAAEFYRHRIAQDMKLVDDLTRSADFTDAFDVFAGFFQNAAAEYSGEAGKVADLGSRVASQTAKELRAGARHALDDMAARTVM